LYLGSSFRLRLLRSRLSLVLAVDVRTINVFFDLGCEFSCQVWGSRLQCDLSDFASLVQIMHVLQVSDFGSAFKLSLRVLGTA